MSTAVNCSHLFQPGYSICTNFWSLDQVRATSKPDKTLGSILMRNTDDVEALVDGQKYIKMVIPAIVNMVYKKLLQHDITARVFSNRDSRVEEDPAVWMTEDSSTIQNRKMFLRWYLIKLNSDPTKFEYWEYLDKVG